MLHALMFIMHVFAFSSYMSRYGSFREVCGRRCINKLAPVVMSICYFVCVAIVEVADSNNNVVASVDVLAVVDVSFDATFWCYCRCG